MVYAETGRLPETLPAYSSKDPYSGQEFEYEITATGFLLGCRAKDCTRARSKSMISSCEDSESLRVWRFLCDAERWFGSVFLPYVPLGQSTRCQRRGQSALPPETSSCVSRTMSNGSLRQTDCRRPRGRGILRYAIKQDIGYAGRRDLQVLTAEYPQNQFFLAELTEELAQSKNANLQETLAVVDRLLAIDPNNAHYRYLRGWVLLNNSGRETACRGSLGAIRIG